ncbi:formate dehydrogenase accessory sulfurtransferase FdhD [Niabella insulamsoli]|uniref:formate dehydrogenase accessory sulfurtransferase FdhD n=1 Tax=Niabella insulamsoli TaxID=3144874 RepID=UPI0031FC8638
MRDVKIPAVEKVPIRKVSGATVGDFLDNLSVEEPLEIKLRYVVNEKWEQRSLAVTMRTPGNDYFLALGFLFTEGIISNSDQINKITSVEENIVLVTLAESAVPKLSGSERNFYTTSSCGVCGKASINSIRAVSPFKSLSKDMKVIQQAVIGSLPEKLRLAQHEFLTTGGIHASGLFTIDGALIALKEDVGRHNALDKLIGAAFIENELPLKDQILVLSGRASFELIQKAAMAGIAMIAMIGAPSTLAVSMARESDITLLGFVKKDSFNIYHQSRFVRISQEP